ncbi:MAG TPA: hypothetical protein PLV67_06015 [Methanofastidiosum sp.]|nr:hypothetical protein [Methanofastidiosum sp.]
MMIEPCPYCGSEVRFDLGTLCVRCPACFYTGPDDDEGAVKHNRISRIVRAAAEYHRIRSLSLMSGHLYNDPLDRQAERRAIRAIFDAVEGGVE